LGISGSARRRLSGERAVHEAGNGTKIKLNELIDYLDGQ
jgi:hypothetical protein